MSKYINKFEYNPVLRIVLTAAVIFFAASLSASHYCVPAAAADASIAKYYETVTLSADGGASVSVELTAGFKGAEMILPVSYGGINGAAAGASSEIKLETVKKGGVVYLKIAPELFDGSSPVKISYSAAGVFDPKQIVTNDFSNIETKYFFVNNTDFIIDSFEALIIMPAGFAVNKVDDYQPKLKKDDPSDPFTLDKKEGFRTVRVKTSALKSGDRVSLKWKMQPEKRSTVFMILLLIAGIWYLAAFTEVINPREHGERAEAHRHHKHDEIARQDDNTAAGSK
ncbi:MAG: hypothetical protein A2008_12980 [Candidatus Wallbacteria bacterium GWC2_49_35]|uniref:Uncharacterized protein n=1 Tax=Candidatus Wallbacteria bacterium GWC2_49_35 TaxID=1817813 RepID=A0A1F7WF63_9BACT|nr:MAG: hypothetical protein A2008_12980 [Candidatus Wallbacteria bacterium GWC2_49_35]HBC75731.1 hypothetical protein [Candidatus Wallbacteria bacterium]